ncbi:bifunctional diaminohydroxyphosphoribosylaminopyrimidine deaminase/5-amino-6-(5-phosphoribosylamino)uracil reductase RibD [Granulosicoccus sp.]|nr:bifunctional diaminohydroxyphosphoribosylaminopyrimidine deaminase/5-amino-6-(5-phosphoribosylamino)uracil reductase RibD [Granulosicoccus sp.]
MQSHEYFMQRALELASRGTGCTSPNPLVGSVVVRDGKIIGEGWHAVHGQAHAEVNAISDALDKLPVSASSGTNKPLTGATIYVSLEPCNHHGLTPPCTQAIIDAGISHVVYALADPNPKAAGGALHMQKHGIEILHGVLQEQARFQNRFFLSHVARKRPYVVAKSATSLDGRIATHTGHSQWITGPESRQRAHELRQAVDAIIVGANTVIADDPALTARLPESVCAPQNIRHPLPVIMDSTGRIPLTRKLLSSDNAHSRTIIAAGESMPAEHRQLLESRGLEVICIPHSSGSPTAGASGLDPHALLKILGERGVQSVLLEGGASIQGSFRDAACIDEVWSFTAPLLIGGCDAPAAYAAIGSDTLADATRLHDVHVETLGQDVLIRGLVDTNTHPGVVHHPDYS